MHGDRAVGAADADVDVQPERVVAPDDVAEELVVPPVVRRVDDPLVLPAAPRMRAGGAERDAHRLDERLRAARAARPSAAAASAKSRSGRSCTSTSDAISSPTRCSSSGVPAAAACSSSKRLTSVERLRVEQRELLLDRDREVRARLERLARGAICSSAGRRCSSPIRRRLARAGLNGTRAEAESLELGSDGLVAAVGQRACGLVERGERREVLRRG